MLIDVSNFAIRLDERNSASLFDFSDGVLNDIGN